MIGDYVLPGNMMLPPQGIPGLTNYKSNSRGGK